MKIKRKKNVILRRGGDVPTATLLGVSFGTYSRRRRDVLMGLCGYVR